MIAETALASLGSGLLGSGVKIAVNLLQLAADNRKASAQERAALAGKHFEFNENFRKDPGNEFVSRTRRVLAWLFALTFCTVVLLWSYFPDVIIYTPPAGGGGTRSILFGLFAWQASPDAKPVSTGAIVWQMIPMMTMILSIYFTPSIRR